MCGIFLLLNNDNTFSYEFVETQFEKGKIRGPEFSKLIYLNDNMTIGFHRLAINGLNDSANQPFFLEDTMLICNGEIYNYKDLYKKMGIIPTTESDCEVIVHLYKRYGIEQTLHMLDGVFAFTLYDFNKELIFVSRDPYGVRPLYSLNLYSLKHVENIIGFASELKTMANFLEDASLNSSNDVMINKMCGKNMIEQFTPGTYQVYSYQKHYKRWMFHSSKTYHSTASFSNYSIQNTETIYRNIHEYLQGAVNKRCIATDRPIACLLSGGLDSSLITALVNEYYKKNMGGKQLETYSIGLADSEDLKYARIVADYLGTKHTEIILDENDFFNLIPDVIRDIESYDTTTVRASIGNYALGKYISTHSEAKVIFNGDGSDELCGGYLYMYKSPDAIEYDNESRRLLKDIHLFDVLRSDKCISSHGLEPRTPFLDKSWVQYYLSIDPSVRFHPGNSQCEKFLLRTSFSKQHFVNLDGNQLLPDNILWRTKEAFSDGVSSHGRSLFTILQEKIEVAMKHDNVQYDKYLHLPPKTLEQYYYRSIFEKNYKNVSNIIPYFWMPKYINANDPSARTLKVYTEINVNK
jgi:asparagine synthase (glutamine-hydrolysing)